MWETICKTKDLAIFPEGSGNRFQVLRPEEPQHINWQNFKYVHGYSSSLGTFMISFFKLLLVYIGLFLFTFWLFKQRHFGNITRACYLVIINQQLIEKLLFYVVDIDKPRTKTITLSFKIFYNGVATFINILGLNVYLTYANVQSNEEQCRSPTTVMKDIWTVLLFVFFGIPIFNTML